MKSLNHSRRGAGQHAGLPQHLSARDLSIYHDQILSYLHPVIAYSLRGS